MPGSRKVAVVGMGGMFPYCKDISEFDQKLFSDQSLIREWPEAMAFGNRVRSKVSGFITEEESGIQAVYSDFLGDCPETFMDKFNRIPDINMATADAGSIWAMIATLDAIRMAGWSQSETESEQTGVIVGSGSCGNQILRPTWHRIFQLGKKTRTAAGAHSVDRTMVYREAANISCLIKNKGITELIGSACATGLGNIGYAYRLIKHGLQDRVIAGGIEATSIESFLGFDAMQVVLSRGFSPQESSRPFDQHRNGFVCSFGTGIVALEEYEMAKARGSKILAVIDSYFNNSDGDGNMFFPSFDGQKRLWEGLLSGTSLKPDVVKAHGTSTPVGDAIELFSIAHVLGKTGYHISAPKSQFGHTLAAAGSIEFICALLMLQNQKVLPCLNSVNLNQEPEAFQTSSDWHGPVEPMAAYRELLPQQTIKKEIGSIACLNYGFGGTNSAILLTKEDT